MPYDITRIGYSLATLAHFCRPLLLPAIFCHFGYAVTDIRQLTSAYYDNTNSHNTSSLMSLTLRSLSHWLLRLYAVQMLPLHCRFTIRITPLPALVVEGQAVNDEMYADGWLAAEGYAMAASTFSAVAGGYAIFWR